VFVWGNDDERDAIMTEIVEAIRKCQHRRKNATEKEKEEYYHLATAETQSTSEMSQSSTNTLETREMSMSMSNSEDQPSQRQLAILQTPSILEEIPEKFATDEAKTTPQSNGERNLSPIEKKKKNRNTNEMNNSKATKDHRERTTAEMKAKKIMELKQTIEELKQLVQQKDDHIKILELSNESVRNTLSVTENQLVKLQQGYDTLNKELLHRNERMNSWKDTKAKVPDKASRRSVPLQRSQLQLFYPFLKN